MYSDLLDVLGGGGSSGSNGNNNRSTNNNNNKHVVLSFKAGQMNLELQEHNNKYWATPDTRRGTVQLVWNRHPHGGGNGGSLSWEWLARRENQVVDSFVTSPGATFGRVEPSDMNPQNVKGRIFILSDPRRMYWMQDASDENDDDIVVKVNQYLANPQDAAPPSSATGATTGGSGDEDAALAQAIRASTAGQQAATTSSSSSSTSSNQVDALSNILENLGMPQTMTGTSGTTSTSTQQQQGQSRPTTGTLTLSDLQGAMQGLAAATATAPTQTTTSGPPLQEVVSSDAITALLQDEAVCQRLLPLLPPSQQSLQYLEDNLRSPQVQQTLRSLTAALQPNAAASTTGSTLEGYQSVLANFQLNPADGDETLRTSGNPIQAFLDCVLASVQQGENDSEQQQEESKEQDENAMDEEKEEEKQDDAMEE